MKFLNGALILQKQMYNALRSKKRSWMLELWFTFVLMILQLNEWKNLKKRESKLLSGMKLTCLKQSIQNDLKALFRFSWRCDESSWWVVLQCSIVHMKLSICFKWFDLISFMENLHPLQNVIVMQRKENLGWIIQEQLIYESLTIFWPLT